MDYAGHLPSRGVESTNTITANMVVLKEYLDHPNQTRQGNKFNMITANGRRQKKDHDIIYETDEGRKSRFIKTAQMMTTSIFVADTT